MGFQHELKYFCQMTMRWKWFNFRVKLCQFSRTIFSWLFVLDMKGLNCKRLKLILQLLSKCLQIWPRFGCVCTLRGHKLLSSAAKKIEVWWHRVDFLPRTLSSSSAVGRLIPKIREQPWVKVTCKDDALYLGGITKLQMGCLREFGY